MQPKWLSFFGGLVLLFIVYHFPEIFSALWIAALFKIGFLILAFFIARWQGWRGLGAYGLALHKGWIRNLIIGLLMGTCFFLFSEWLSVMAGFEEIISVKSLSAIIKVLPLTLLMTFFPSIAEDILTRGYLYAHLQKILKPAAFILLSSLFYVLNHIWRLTEGAHVLCYLFILGIVLAWALIYTKSLWLTLGIHWGSNIAFEMINAATTANTFNKTYSTWILAGCFALMLVASVVIRKIFSKGSS